MSYFQQRDEIDYFLFKKLVKHNKKIVYSTVSQSYPNFLTWTWRAAKILFQKQEDLFYEARTVWTELEEWAKTEKVSEIFFLPKITELFRRLELFFSQCNTVAQNNAKS